MGTFDIPHQSIASSRKDVCFLCQECLFLIISKSVEMVNLTIALFARFRVNGDVFDILKLSGMETMNIIS